MRKPLILKPAGCCGPPPILSVTWSTLLARPGLCLRENGDLLEIDEDSGKENVIVKFALPFQLAQPQISAYELAYDKEIKF